MSYVVVMFNSSGALAAVGTATGRLFRSEASAEAAKGRLEQRYPHASGLVLEVEQS